MRLTKYCAFDIETTGFLKYEGDTIFSYSITNWHGETTVRRLDTKDGEANLKYLQDFFDDTSIAKIAHNAKFELGFTRAFGINVPQETEWHDTMILSQIINNLNASHALDNLAMQIFKYPKDQDDEIKPYITEYRRQFKKTNPDSRINLSGYQAVPIDLMDKYQIADTERTMLLYRAMAPKLFAEPVMWADYLHEIELIKATVYMEEFGVFVDQRELEKLHKFLTHEVADAKATANKIVGREINLNSPTQLANYIYNDLGIRCDNFTASGKQSASKDILMEHKEKHPNPFFEAALKFRSYDKGLSMIESYRTLAHPITGRIHPNLKTNPAKTGRQSCSEPNLQNVTKEISVTTAYGVAARNCFRADIGHVLFLIDYAGIELRLIVDACNEYEFIEFIRDGIDVHGQTSSMIYGEHWDQICQLVSSPAGVKIPEWLKKIPREEYNDDYANVKYNMRTSSKNFGFGKAYGGGFGAITSNLVGLTDKQKREGDARFKKRWPRLSNFTPDIIAEVRKNGYVTTAFGRRLYVPKSQAYIGANYKIQGTAAGILKRAETRVSDYSMHELDFELRPVLTIHDELIVDMPRHLLPRQQEILKHVAMLMTKHKEIKVLLEVEAKMSTSTWSHAKNYHI